MTTTLQTPGKKTKKPITKVLLILFVIIGLLCICSVFGYFYGKTPSYKATATAKAELSILLAPTPKPTSTPEVTKTPESTNTPEPTNTPKSTNTPRPTNTPEPTNTPKSTNAPRPTNTPEPTTTPTTSDNAEKLIYLNKIQPLMTNLTEKMGTLSQMSNLMSEDISLLFDTSFTKAYFAVLDSINDTMQEIVSYKPPTSLQTMYGYLKDASVEFGSVRSLIKSGITNFDFEDINAGTEHLNKFGDYLILATGAVE